MTTVRIEIARSCAEIAYTCLLRVRDDLKRITDDNPAAEWQDMLASCTVALDQVKHITDRFD